MLLYTYVGNGYSLSQINVHICTASLFFLYVNEIISSIYYLVLGCISCYFLSIIGMFHSLTLDLVKFSTTLITLQITVCRIGILNWLSYFFKFTNSFLAGVEPQETFSWQKVFTLMCTCCRTKIRTIIFCRTDYLCLLKKYNESVTSTNSLQLQNNN